MSEDERPKAMTEDEKDEVEGHKVKAATDESSDDAESDDEVEAHRTKNM